MGEPAICNAGADFWVVRVIPTKVVLVRRDEPHFEEGVEEVDVRFRVFVDELPESFSSRSTDEEFVAGAHLEAVRGEGDKARECAREVREH